MDTRVPLLFPRERISRNLGQGWQPANSSDLLSFIIDGMAGEHPKYWYGLLASGFLATGFPAHSHYLSESYTFLPRGPSLPNSNGDPVPLNM